MHAEEGFESRTGVLLFVKPKSSGSSYFQERKGEIVQTIRQLVETESPSDNKDAVDRLGSLLAGRFEGLGGHAKFHRVPNFGDHLQVDFAGASARQAGHAARALGHRISTGHSGDYALPSG